MNLKSMFTYFVSILVILFFEGCSFQESKSKKVWIYTSLYKDTLADIEPKLKLKFPHLKFQFYQAGSEEVAAKVQAENLAGEIQADILISSDRFWYEELAEKKKLISFKNSDTEKVDSAFKHPENYYTTLSHPVMVIAYNSEVITEKDAPKSFKELTDPKWKDKISSGSPLASGTNFTTIAFLVKNYGWSYIENLRKNNIITEGGNSGVIRRLQSQERPVGIVLLENVLRLTKIDPKIKFITPLDGSIIHSNVLALVKKKSTIEDAAFESDLKQVAEWFFSTEGQSAMARSYMYPATQTETKLGHNAPEFATLLKTAPNWDRDFINQTMKDRAEIKNKFTKIIF